MNYKKQLGLEYFNAETPPDHSSMFSEYVAWIGYLAHTATINKELDRLETSILTQVHNGIHIVHFTPINEFVEAYVRRYLSQQGFSYGLRCISDPPDAKFIINVV